MRQFRFAQNLTVDVTKEPYCEDDKFWKILHTKTQKIDQTEDNFRAPSGRFGHSMEVYNNFLLIFGGSGVYDRTTKMRTCNNELHIFNLMTNNWIEQPIRKKVLDLSPSPRMYHASAIVSLKVGRTISKYLLIHGGINTNKRSHVISANDERFEEDKHDPASRFHNYNDMFLYNIEESQWVEILQAENTAEILGDRSMHTMTTFPPDEGLLLEEKDAMEQRIGSSQDPNHGIYMFGGFKHNKGQMNDLWLIQPLPVLKDAKPRSKSTFRAKMNDKFPGFEVTKLEPAGIPPIERVLHTA